MALNLTHWAFKGHNFTTKIHYKVASQNVVLQNWRWEHCLHPSKGFSELSKSSLLMIVACWPFYASSCRKRHWLTANTHNVSKRKLWTKKGTAPVPVTELHLNQSSSKVRWKHNLTQLPSIEAWLHHRSVDEKGFSWKPETGCQQI